MTLNWMKWDMRKIKRTKKNDLQSETANLKEIWQKKRKKKELKKDNSKKINAICNWKENHENPF